MFLTLKEHWFSIVGYTGTFLGLSLDWILYLFSLYLLTYHLMNVKLCRAFILNRLVKYVFPICCIVPAESVNIQICIYDVSSSGIRLIRIYHILHLHIITAQEYLP